MAASLKDRVVLISGALGGMGRVACQRFCDQGASVIGISRSADEEDGFAGALRDEGHSVEIRQVDISSAASLERLCDDVRSRYGRVDVLYNNAGVNLGKSLQETTDDEWQHMLDVNLTSAFRIMKLMAPLMPAGRGSIINVASIAALEAFPNSAAYNTSKAALAMLTRSAAVDLAPEIRVNAICPGIVDTPMPRALVSSNPEGSEIWKQWEEGAVLGRVGKPEEIIALALFLASDQASFITGAVIPADGGWTLC
jgi:NAD(P)-dependent dehydrogenase (short-subunit alcohol dehydrogenase family)